MITFVTGGCRSGKSRHAQALAEATARSNRTFIATCVPYDDEMRDRVRRHQADRDRTWTTVEAPLDLPGAIAEQRGKSAVVLADCLTLWATNILLDPVEADRAETHLEKLTAALAGDGCPAILVSNEVGCGIVPENALARRFRDLVGHANQRVAAVADQVVWCVSGIPVPLKSPRQSTAPFPPA
ncbi:MAG: bifunctional adenosylcobinamide kinase/adenosylcobinamide-phosphate guanylyltransferase [Desulfococcaceae bacterium]